MKHKVPNAFCRLNQRRIVKDLWTNTFPPPTRLQSQQYRRRLRPAVPVMEHGDVPCGHDLEEPAEGPRPLGELDDEDLLVRDVARVAARAAAHHVPQVHLRGLDLAQVLRGQPRGVQARHEGLQLPRRADAHRDQHVRLGAGGVAVLELGHHQVRIGEPDLHKPTEGARDLEGQGMGWGVLSYNARRYKGERECEGPDSMPARPYLGDGGRQHRLLAGAHIGQLGHQPVGEVGGGYVRIGGHQLRWRHTESDRPAPRDAHPYRSRSKFMFAPEVMATTVLPDTPARCKYDLAPASATAPAGSRMDLRGEGGGGRERGGQSHGVREAAA